MVRLTIPLGADRIEEIIHLLDANGVKYTTNSHSLFIDATTRHYQTLLAVLDLTNNREFIVADA